MLSIDSHKLHHSAKWNFTCWTNRRGTKTKQNPGACHLISWFFFSFLSETFQDAFFSVLSAGRRYLIRLFFKSWIAPNDISKEQPHNWQGRLNTNKDKPHHRLGINIRQRTFPTLSCQAIKYVCAILLLFSSIHYGSMLYEWKNWVQMIHKPSLETWGFLTKVLQEKKNV